MFARAAGAKIMKLSAGHMPMLSQLASLAEKVTAAAREAIAETQESHAQLSSRLHISVI
jgi:hypothetical protein